MKRKRRRTRTTTGSKSRISALAAGLAVLATCMALAEKRQQAPEPGALIAVSVFREPGFALPGADLQLAPASSKGKASAKVKKLKAATDARGEFVFRVPPVPSEYKLSVSSKGSRPQDKAIFINGEERVDVTFMLEQESK